jgi:murein L,D-transpeptidase YcbB/YkuD
MAIGLGVLLSSLLLPAQAPAEDYSDIMGGASSAPARITRETITTASVEQPVVQTVQPEQNIPDYSNRSPGNFPDYTFPPLEQPLFPAVAPLLNGPMQGRSLESGLEIYNGASRKATIRSFYEQRSFSRAWTSDNSARESAWQAVEILEQSALEGLNPGEYHVDEIRQAYVNGDFTLLELLLTDNVLRYASHVRDGQYTPSAVDPHWMIKFEVRGDIVTQLNKALGERRVGEYLRNLVPPHVVYQNLRRQLRTHAELANNGGWPGFPFSGMTIKPGMRHPHVALLRARLAVTDGADSYYVSNPEYFDQDLQAALENFQSRHGLNADGVVGPKTREALSVPVQNRVRQILASMERFRWIPRNLGNTNVVVNVPAFRLWYTENGSSALTMRTIVGKTRVDHQTPSFTDRMQYLVLNPNWNVPSSIASKEISKEVSEDPEYLDRGGYTVFDSSGNVIDPTTIEWSRYGGHNPLPYRIVQSRGADGVLGSVKFMFPNRHGIYLHDTQTRHLFKKDERAYSHGCIRIEKPMELASRLLGGSPEEIDEMIRNSSKNRHIDLQVEIPVYLVYMTAWVDEDAMHFYDDLYNRDRDLVVMNTSRRRV